MTVAFGLDEYRMTQLVPVLRASATRWLRWLESPSDPWPEPKNLARCVALMDSLAAADPIIDPHALCPPEGEA